MRGDASTEGAKLWYENNTGDIFLDQIYDNASGQIFFRNRTAGTALNTMTLVNGNVGIGTVSPGSYKLNVNGPMTATSINLGSSGSLTENWWEFGVNDGVTGTGIDFHGGTTLTDRTARILRFAGDNGNFQFENKGSGNIYFTLAGNVGIGTTTPTSRLEVKADPSSGVDDILFSVKDKDGNNVFVVYPEWVQVIVPETTKDKTNKRGAFVVSGRGTKGETHFMDMTDENYLIGHNVAPNIEGTKNSIIGYEAANSLTSGTNNVMIGWNAGKLGLTGSRNVFIGNAAGMRTTGATAERNVFIGYESGAGNTSGRHNTFIGGWTGILSSTGEYNTYLGAFAGAGTSTGSYNVFVGHNTGGNSSTGNYNTFIGTEAGYNSTSSYSVFIGRDAGKNESNNYKLYIDNSSISTPLIYGDFNTNIVRINGDLQYTGTLTDVSDKRLKKNLQVLNNSIEYLKQIDGLYFYWRTDEYPDMVLSEERQIGVIAQDVEKVFPELVVTDEDGYKAVDYVKFTPILIEAIKEQQKVIEVLENKSIEKDKEIEKLKEENQKQNIRLQVIEKYIQEQAHLPDQPSRQADGQANLGMK